MQIMQINRETRHVQLNPRDPSFYNDPYPTYEILRAQTPIFFWEEFNFWCFLAHEDVDAILRDRRFGRQILHVATRDELGMPPERADLKPFYDVDRYSMLELEPPDHTRIRSLVQKAFMARQIEQLRGEIESLTNRLIDAMLEKGDSVDLLADFATPIPVHVIAKLLGVPTDMSQNLLDWSHAMVGMYELARSPRQEQKAVRAAQEFVAYLRDYVAMRRKKPQDDLLSRLIEAEEAGEKLSEDELVSTCILLLNAGHEATVNVIGNGVRALLHNPAQLVAWRQDLTITPTAVEELLRFDTPLHLFNRWVLEDLTHKGQQFAKGTQIALMLGAANRDPNIFDAPTRLNLQRHPNPHLSLGGGIHYCLGAPLARLELQIALPILLNRIPTLVLKNVPAYKDTYHFHGIESLWLNVKYPQ